MKQNKGVKRAMEWFYSTFFQDEPIIPATPREAKPQLPALLRQARNLRDPYIPREVLFLKQGKLLAEYEDDYSFTGTVTRYYPTYQSLDDDELRGYFSWRTQLRQGNLSKTCLSFAFLYAYELINQIGITSPMEGFTQLKTFRDAYGALDETVIPYLDKWMIDYAVFYGIDSSFLSGHPQLAYNATIATLAQMERCSDAQILQALKSLSPKWLQRSRFYREHPQDMDIVIARTLRRASDHYATRCKRGFVEQYFGSFEDREVKLFASAVFLEPPAKKRVAYCLDALTTYRKEDGKWFVHHFVPYPNGNRIEDLLKGIDSITRDVWGYKYPIGCDVTAKWLLKIIREEAVSLRAEQEAAEESKIVFDFTRLSHIRQDAAITQEKLMVDEELLLPEESETPPVPPASASDVSLLTPTEYRLLQCLLYDRDLGWVRSEGLLLSVLVDSINEKLYDTFLDSVLDDTPALIEDYLPDLKEIISP